MRRTSIAMLCLLTCLEGTVPPRLQAQEQSNLATYMRAVELYRRGNPVDATKTLSSLDAEAVRDGVERFVFRLQAPTRSELIGAAMLHVDIALSERNLRRGTSFLVHAPLAANLFAAADERYPLGPEVDATGLRAARAIARVLLDDLFDLRARAHIELALKKFRNDGSLLLMLGVAYENSAAGPGDVYTVRGLASARTRQNADLAAARKALDRVLMSMPESTEALMHRARLDVLHGDDAAAERRFESLLASSPPAQWRYLALMFLGDIRARAGSIDAAVQWYREALQLFPSAQSGIVALSELLQRSGDAASAAALVEQLIGRDRSNDPDDPWQQYRYGHARLAEPELSALRDEGRR